MQRPNDLSPSAGYLALRSNAAWIDYDAFQFVLKLSGDAALDALDRSLPGKLLYLHAFKAELTAVLDDGLKIVDILQVVNLEVHYLIIGSAAAREQVHRLLERPGLSLEDASPSLAMIGVEGPYAWRTLKAAFGGDVLGLGIQSAIELDRPGTGKCVIVRSGHSGEYAYRILCERACKAAILDRLAGGTDLPELSQEDLGLAALETRMPLCGAVIKPGDCPFEQDLRYMFDFFKDDSPFPERLRARSEEPGRGIVAFLADRAVDPDQAITLNGEPVGQVKEVRYSPALAGYFGYALLDPACAYPCGEDLEPGFKCGGASLVTRSSPLLTTLSASIVRE